VNCFVPVTGLELNRFTTILLIICLSFPQKSNQYYYTIYQECQMNLLIYDFLRYETIDHTDETFFEGIMKLSQAHCMVVDMKGTMTIKRLLG